MKTKFVNKVIMFKKTVEFNNVIIFCYRRQKFVVLQKKIPKAWVWAITEAIICILNPIVLACVMNQSRYC
jgi:hypothetical protein